MAHENKVIRSVNLSGEMVCVDLFQRPDGSFGYDEFRRDPEDGARGWYSIGHYSAARFDSCDAAWAQALTDVRWLRAAWRS
ncbi:MAG: hypothetical protein AB8B82_17920 [Roseovarius sp.]